MTVARRLGIRYLWVDSLCIVQDGAGDDWLDAIRKMDVVYGAAYLVICAAGSLSAFAGIEGVEGGRGPGGEVRAVEQIADGFRLAFYAASHNELEGLPYNNHGWTYQENHFASRTLTFAHGTVTLECRSGVEFSENRFEDTEVIKKPRRPGFPGDNNDIGETEGRIQTYSGRQLTKDTDVYRAFAGVARQIRRSLRSDLCHGLPTRFFDWFLLWQPLKAEAPRRRSIAPSWSWAGWHGDSWSRIWDWYTRDMQLVRRGIRKRTWIAWYQREGHGSVRCEPMQRYKTMNGGGEERNHYGGKMRKEERFHGIDCSVTAPMARSLTGEGLPQYTHDLISENPGSGFLQFWTVSVAFELRRGGSGDDSVYGPQVPRQQLDPSGSSSDDDWSDVDGSDGNGSGSEDMFPPPNNVGSDDEDDDSDIDFNAEFDSDEQPGVKLIIGGKSGRALGRIYVSTEWAGLAELDASDGPYRREFVLLCEARDQRAENLEVADEDGGWRYRVMLVDPKLGGEYFERVSVGSVGLGDLGEAVGGIVWKEFILG